MKIFLTIAYILLLNIVAVFAGNTPVSAEQSEQAEYWMRSQPVQFLENRGQMADMEGNPVPFVLFKASVPDMDMYVTQKGLTYVFIKAEEEHEENPLALAERSERIEHKEESRKIEWSRIDMELKGASIEKENILKETPSVTDFNYFYAHCSEGIYGVKQYEKITIKNIYPNIDWVLYNVPGKGFKYDFIVHPNANPKQIELVYCSKEGLTITSNGNIELQTELSTLTESAPVCYQKGTVIEARYIKTLNEKNDKGGYDTHIKFEIENYDKAQTLIIDPLTIPNLTWGTYYGGNGTDGFCSMVTDISGNVFVTGYTPATNFPTQNPGSGAYFQGALLGGEDAFILKFSNAGVRLWATHYGGTSLEQGFSLATDGAGNLFVTGYTRSTDFPILNSGTYFQGVYGGGNGDAFILKFTNAGVRLWATYYGGTVYDMGYSIAVDINSNVFVTGRTSSGNFPTQNPGGGVYFQAANSGTDAFILKFSNTGTRLWATYYGGSGTDEGYSIDADGTGNVFVTGRTNSSNFPTQNPGGGAYFQVANAGLYDIFILKFTNAGVRQWATYYGGSATDENYSLDTDGSGNLFVKCRTNSTNIPTQNPGGGAYFQVANAGLYDIFLLKFSNAGVRAWATYYGGSGDDGRTTYIDSREKEIVVDASGDVFVTGETRSSNFPTQNSGGYFRGAISGTIDVFILQFSNTGARKWATYNGTPISDFGTALSVDPSGCLFAAGEWIGAGSNGLMPAGGGAYYDGSFNNSDDSYLMKFCSPNTVLTLTANLTNILCKGQCTGTATANPLGGTSPYAYSWNTVPVQISATITGLCPGSYVVTVTDGSGSTATATVMVTEPSLALTVTVTSTNASCTGGNNGTALAAAGGGTPGYTYSWTPGGATTQSISNLAAGTYSVLITDANGCTVLQTVTISNSGSMTATAASSDTCGTNNGTAIAAANGGTAPYTYLWSPSGGNNPTAAGLSPGTYTCSITDANGCTITTTVTVIVNPNPIANAGINITIVPGTSTTLVATGGGTYLWTPTNGLSNPAISNPIATPTVTTQYCVTVTDTNGCTAVACVTVTVELFDCLLGKELYLPNAFSPNSDGENDMLQIYYSDMRCIKDLKLTIYDRWGEKVFEANDPENKWDGSYQGKRMNTAVFAYYLEATLISGETITKKGNISLIR